MERAKHEYYASILAVVLLLAPQLSFARGMSGGAAGRAGSSSFTSVGSGSARMGFSGHALLPEIPPALSWLLEGFSPSLRRVQGQAHGHLSSLSRLTVAMWIFAIALGSL